MISCLAKLPKLERLVMGFKEHPHPNRLSTDLPPLERSILPSLTHLHFKGHSEYLEALVERVDAPHLYHLIVTFSPGLSSNVPQLLEFMNRTKRIMELCQTREALELNPWSVRKTDKSSGDHLELGTRYDASRWRISSLVRLCRNLSPFVSQVRRLRICEDPDHPGLPVDVESVEWLDVFLLFSSVTLLNPVGRKMASLVAYTLEDLTGEDDEDVFPELNCILFDGSGLPPILEEVLDPFIVARRQYAYRKIDVFWSLS
jgi:hypothetical protein